MTSAEVCVLGVTCALGVFLAAMLGYGQGWEDGARETKGSLLRNYVHEQQTLRETWRRPQREESPLL